MGRERWKNKRGMGEGRKEGRGKGLKEGERGMIEV